MIPSLLAIFAHPDDEVFTGGTLSHYADQGVRVTLVCATKGDAGKVTDPELKVSGPEELATLRAGELQRATALLGLNDVRMLGYGDSGREERTRTGDTAALMNVPLQRSKSGCGRSLPRSRRRSSSPSTRTAATDTPTI